MRTAGRRLADEVSEWVEANGSLDLSVREWWRRLFEVGYCYPMWPERAGGAGMSPRDATIVTTVLARHHVIAPPLGNVAATLAAPTILEHGSPEPRRRARSNDRSRRGFVVSAVQRTRLRVRPRQHRHEREACR